MMRSASRRRCSPSRRRPVSLRRRLCNRMLSAIRSSPSRCSTLAIRRSSGSTSGSTCRGLPPGMGTDWGEALAGTTSSGAMRPAPRLRSSSSSWLSSASPRRSHLLSTSSRRLPRLARAVNTSISAARRSPSTTSNSRSAEAACSRASCSRCWPAAPASRMPGVSTSTRPRLRPRSRSR